MTEDPSSVLLALAHQAAQLAPEVIAVLDSVLADLQCQVNEVVRQQSELSAQELEWRRVCSGVGPIVKLNFRGVVLEAEVATLLSQDCLYFLLRLTRRPDHGGAFFIDRNALGFEAVLEYLRSGVLDLEGVDPQTALSADRLMTYFGLQKRRPAVCTHGRASGDSDCVGRDGVLVARGRVSGYLDLLQATTAALERAETCLQERREAIAGYQRLFAEESAVPVVRLSLRGRLFETLESTLLVGPGSYFHAMLSSGKWSPADDGVYYIDRPHEGFDRILDYCLSGRLSFVGLSDWESQCLENNLDYFQVRAVGALFQDLTWYKTLKGHSDCVTALAQLPDGRICSGSRDKSIRVWSFSGETSDAVLGHPDSVAYMVTLTDGRVCSSILESPLIFVWDVSTRRCVHTLDNSSFWARLFRQLMLKGLPVDHVGPMIELHDGSLCCSWDGDIRVWDVDRRKIIRTVSTPWAGIKHDVGVCSILQLNDKRVAVASIFDDRIFVINILSGVCEISLETRHKFSGWPMSLIESPIGQLLCMRKSAVSIWDLQTASLLKESETELCYYDVALLRNGKVCSTVYIGGNFLVVWDLDTCRFEKKFEYDKSVTALISLSNGAVCFASSDFSIKVWS